MSEDFLLLNPGPVPVTDEVLDSMAEPMVSHRSADFEAVYERAQDGLEYVFTQSTLDGEATATGGTPLILNGTATMGMEAAVANAVDEGDRVVSLINGKFGRRFARIADRYTDDVVRVKADWGESIPIGKVETAVDAETTLVTMVHNETSTGLLNPVSEVGELADDADATFVVDGVTSIGGDEFRVDDWNVDVAITDAQKALAAPPGVSAMYVAEGVEEVLDGESAPFYEDLDWHLRKADQHQTPFTSAVPLFRALATAVEDIESEGMADRIARHRTQSAAFREGYQAMGLELFADADGPTDFSNTLTAIALPEEIRGDRASEFMDAVSERNVSISGGQAHLGGEIFRVSNMGHFSPEEIVRGVRVVGEALQDVGVDTDVDAGVLAAEERLGQL